MRSLSIYIFFFVNAGVPLELVDYNSCEVQVPVLQPKDAARGIPEYWIIDPSKGTVLTSSIPNRVNTTKKLSGGAIAWF